MKATHKVYDHTASSSRIDQIIAASENSFEELDSIPSRERLTFTNGFYVNCTAVFMDLRNSSELPSKHTRPKLAKLYRSYISETIAVLSGHSKVAEVSIDGDAVWAVIDTPYKSDIDEAFSTGARLNSLVRTLNCKYRRHGIEQISAGIGMSYGRALMIKAGYSGSGTNDVVWMGDVVNESAKLSGYGNKTWSDEPLMVAEVVRNNLNDRNKGFLSWNSNRACYHGNVVNSAMDEWYQKNCA